MEVSLKVGCLPSVVGKQPTDPCFMLGCLTSRNCAICSELVMMMMMAQCFYSTTSQTYNPFHQRHVLCSHGHGDRQTMQWRSDDFRAPRQQLVWAPGQRVTATTSSWRAPSAPRAPRSRGACGALATPLKPCILPW